MSPAATRITLLGRTAIERDGVPVATVSGRRAELVFAYLTIERHRGVSRDELADALWPEMLPDTWNAALRSVLTDVRRTFERAGFVASEVLLNEQGRVRLELPAGTAIDVEEAREALACARDRLAAGAPGTALDLAQRAAAAADATFLPFHDDRWSAEVRAGLESLHIDALRLAGDAAIAASEPQQALSAADRLVRADPFLEAGHRLRIQSLGELGDRAGALKAYERCKALLEAELGIGPQRRRPTCCAKPSRGRPRLTPPRHRSSRGTPAARSSSSKITTSSGVPRSRSCAASASARCMRRQTVPLPSRSWIVAPRPT